MWISIFANIPYIVYFIYMKASGGNELIKREEREFLMEFIFNGSIEIYMIIMIPFSISMQTKLQMIRYDSVLEQSKKDGAYMLYLDGKREYVEGDEEEGKDVEEEQDNVDQK